MTPKPLPGLLLHLGRDAAHAHPWRQPDELDEPDGFMVTLASIDESPCLTENEIAGNHWPLIAQPQVARLMMMTLAGPVKRNPETRIDEPHRS